VHLDSVEQIATLLEAAGQLDRDKRWLTDDRRPIIATLLLAGSRAGELCNLRWRDVDVANGRISIGRSKTQAGLREIVLLPLLRDELSAHKARAYRSGPDDPVFPTGTGGHRDKDNLRNRILASAVKRADKLLEARGQTPLPRGVTPHKLRHTFASILIATGEDPASVMAQLGHTDPKFTLRVYTHMMRRGPAERAQLKALVDGDPVELSDLATSEREARQ
jgi:integrase